MATTQSVVNAALSQIGVKYDWGGSSPGTGFDCSGLTQWAYSQVGVTIPRDTQDQWNAGTPVPLGPAANPLSNAQPGDLVFYGMNNTDLSNQHVGIILSNAGNGTMIDAPHTGAFVRTESVTDFASSSEPLSGIRRFTGAGVFSSIGLGASAATGDTTTAQVTPTSKIAGCWFSWPSIDLGITSIGGGCAVTISVRDKIFGGTLIAVGGLVMLVGVTMTVLSTRTGQQAGLAAAKAALL